MVSLSLLLLVTEGMHSGRFRGYFGVFAFGAGYPCVICDLARQAGPLSGKSFREKTTRGSS